MKTTSQLIDQIYAAALDPAAWSVALGSLQDFFRSLSIGIYSIDLHGQRAIPLDLRNVDPGYVRIYIDRFIYDNPWSGIPDLQAPGLIRTDSTLDQYLNSPGFYRSTEYFNEWMKPQDFIHSLGVNLLSCDGLLTKFYMYRSARVGPFTKREQDRFGQVLCHLMKAVEVGRRLEVEEARVGDTMHFVDRLKFGVVFLDDNLQVVHANRFAANLIHGQDGVKLVQGVICAACRDDEKLLAGVNQIAMAIRRERVEKAPPVVSLRRASGKRPLCVIAMPLPRQTNPFLVRRASMVLVITDPEVEPVIPGDYLRQRYGLTTNESMLVQYLVQGDDLRAAADRLGIRYESARSYLKIVFQKTGASRQSELIRMLVADRALVEI